MRIPLPKMMRYWRQHDYALAKRSELPQRALRLWAWLVRRPALYHRATRIGARLLWLMSGRKGLSRSLPFAQGWMKHRDFPAPAGSTFQAQWAKRRGGRHMSNLNPQSRDIVLGRIRRALGAKDDDVERRVAVQRRLNAPVAGPLPARTQGSRPELIQQLKMRLEALSATAEVAKVADIPGARRRFPQAQQPAGPGALGRRRAARWSRLVSQAPSVTVEHGRADPKDEVSLTRAVAAAAETGTLVLVSGTDNPTTLSFLPETEIIVVRAEDVEGSYEATWGRIRALYGDRTMPRSVNWVSGPSRTGDIDQTLVLGAHGPRRLHVVIAEG